MIKGWYYMHKNGSLIYKPDAGAGADIRDSDFTVAMWPFDPENRAEAWRILVEAGALGVDRSRIDELAGKWGCDDADGLIYARHLRLKLESNHNVLDQLTTLCKNLGFKGGKLWQATFHDLIKKKALEK